MAEIASYFGSARLLIQALCPRLLSRPSVGQAGLAAPTARQIENRVTCLSEAQPIADDYIAGAGKLPADARRVVVAPGAAQPSSAGSAGSS